jgi:uncharacterized protein (TIGR03086 family)
MSQVDIEPATKTLADVVAATPDEALSGPTPCEQYTLADLLDHVEGLSRAFVAVAKKDLDNPLLAGAPGDASHLAADWRERIPRNLGELAEAWRDPEAWTGMTRAGGFDMPGEVAGVVTLDEVVLHGWDVARATGQPFDCDERLLEHVYEFVKQFASPEPGSGGLFGPIVDVPEDAPLLDRVLGLAGRDPGWTTPR